MQKTAWSLKEVGGFKPPSKQYLLTHDLLDYIWLMAEFDDSFQKSFHFSVWFLIYFIILFFEKESHCVGWPWAHYVAQLGPKFTLILLLQPPKYWDYQPAPPYLARFWFLFGFHVGSKNVFFPIISFQIFPTLPGTIDWPCLSLSCFLVLPLREIPSRSPGLSQSFPTWHSEYFVMNHHPTSFR